MQKIVILFLVILAACAPVPAYTVDPGSAAEAQAAAGRATDAAEKRQQAAQSTAVAIQDKQIKAELEAQRVAAEAEQKKAAMQATASAESLQGTTVAQATLDAWKQATATADEAARRLQSTSTAQYLEGQQAQLIITQAAATATQGHIELKASQEAITIGGSTQATVIANQAAPTLAWQAATRQEERKDKFYSLAGWGIFMLLFAIGIGIAWIIILAGEKRVDVAVAARLAQIQRQPVAQFSAVRGIPQINEYQQPERRPSELEQFVQAAIKIAGASATELPGHEAFRRAGIQPWSGGGSWHVAATQLFGMGCIEKVGALNQPWKIADDGTLADVLRWLQSPSPSVMDVKDSFQERSWNV